MKTARAAALSELGMRCCDVPAFCGRRRRLSRGADEGDAPHFAGFGNAARRGVGGHHSARAATEEWLTPPRVIEALGGWQSFDLDPCLPIERPFACPSLMRRLLLKNETTAHAVWLGR